MNTKAGVEFYSVTLDWPDKMLFPNNSKGRHWSVIQAPRNLQKRKAMASTAAACPKATVEKTVSLHITFAQPLRGRVCDRDNCIAALKGAMDGIALALGIDDSKFESVTYSGPAGIARVQDGAVLVSIKLSPRARSE